MEKAQSKSRVRTTLHRQLEGQRVILASSSPRRQQLLAQVGLKDVEIVPSTFPENLDKSAYSPLEYAVETASAKAHEVYERLSNDISPPALVVSADTVVLCGNTVLEKPRDKLEHLRMLKTLRNSKLPIKVVTAVVCMAPMSVPVQPGYWHKSTIEETEVQFDRNVSDEVLEAFVNAGAGADAAGGFQVQNEGALLISRVVGDYSNIVGLPLRATFKLMERVLNADHFDEDQGADEEDIGGDVGV